MPKVPIYQERINPDPMPGVRSNVDAPIEAYNGGPLAAQATGAGQDLIKTAHAIFTEEKRKADEAAVMGAVSQAQSKITNTTSNFSQQFGLSAHANYNAFKDDAIGTVNSIGDTLTNETQKEMFAPHKNALMGQLQSEMDRHTAVQSTAAYVDNADSLVKTSLTAGLNSYTDPKIVADAYKRMADATVAKGNFLGKSAEDTKSAIMDAQGVLTLGLIKRNLYDGQPGSIDRAETVLAAAEQHGLINAKDTIEVNQVLKQARIENNFQTSYAEVASHLRTSTGEMDVDKQVAYYTDKDKGNPLALNYDLGKVYEWAKRESFNNLRIQRSETDKAISWAQNFQDQEKQAGRPASSIEIDRAIRAEVDKEGGTATTKLKNTKILTDMLTHDRTKDDSYTVNILMGKLAARTLTAGDIKDALAGGLINMETARNFNEGATNSKYGVDMYTNGQHLKNLNIQLGYGDVYIKGAASEETEQKSHELSDRFNEAQELEKTIVKRHKLTVEENRGLLARVAMNWMADHHDEYPVGKQPGIMHLISPSTPGGIIKEEAPVDKVAEFLKANNKADNKFNRDYVAAHPELLGGK